MRARDVSEMADQVEKANNDVPLFGAWRRAYIAVVAVFVLEILLFYFVGRYFS